MGTPVRPSPSGPGAPAVSPPAGDHVLPGARPPGTGLGPDAGGVPGRRAPADGGHMAALVRQEHQFRHGSRIPPLPPADRRRRRRRGHRARERPPRPRPRSGRHHVGPPHRRRRRAVARRTTCAVPLRPGGGEPPVMGPPRGGPGRAGGIPPVHDRVGGRRATHREHAQHAAVSSGSTRLSHRSGGGTARGARGQRRAAGGDGVQPAHARPAATTGRRRFGRVENTRRDAGPHARRQAGVARGAVAALRQGVLPRRRAHTGRCRGSSSARGERRAPAGDSPALDGRSPRRRTRGRRTSRGSAGARPLPYVAAGRGT